MFGINSMQTNPSIPEESDAVAATPSAVVQQKPKTGPDFLPAADLLEIVTHPKCLAETQNVPSHLELDQLAIDPFVLIASAQVTHPAADHSSSRNLS